MPYFLQCDGIIKMGHSRKWQWIRQIEKLMQHFLQLLILLKLVVVLLLWKSFFPFLFSCSWKNPPTASSWKKHCFHIWILLWLLSCLGPKVFSWKFDIVNTDPAVTHSEIILRLIITLIFILHWFSLRLSSNLFFIISFLAVTGSYVN